MQPNQTRMKAKSSETETDSIQQSKQVVKKTVLQFIAFGFVGLINTAVDVVVYWALLQVSVYYVVANALAYGAGMLNSYLWNNKFTFRQANQKLRTEASDPKPGLGKIGRFIIWNSFSLALSSILMVLFIDFVQWTQLWSKLVTVVIIVAVQFIGMKRWVFRD